MLSTAMNWVNLLHALKLRSSALICAKKHTRGEREGKQSLTLGVSVFSVQSGRPNISELIIIPSVMFNIEYVQWPAI